MSVLVEIDRLEEVLGDFGLGYLLTTDTQGRVKVVSVAPRWVDGRLVCAPSSGTTSNLDSNRHATLVFPPREEGGMSLLVDGEGVSGDDAITVTPTSAVLHRSATLR